MSDGLYILIPLEEYQELTAEKNKATGDVIYLCDRTKCENCRDFCRHTADIAHAVNFKKIGGLLYEEKAERDIK